MASEIYIQSAEIRLKLETPKTRFKKVEEYTLFPSCKKFDLSIHPLGHDNVFYKFGGELITNYDQELIFGNSKLKTREINLPWLLEVIKRNDTLPVIYDWLLDNGYGQAATHLEKDFGLNQDE